MTARVTRWLQAPLRTAPVAFSPRAAICVLGAPVRPDGTLSRGLRERVQTAAALYHRAPVPVCVTGGATRAGQPSEAAAMAQALRALGVDDRDLVLEEVARSTYGNATHAFALLHPRGLTQVWLVTHPFHSRRAASLFRRAGFEPAVWPVEAGLDHRGPTAIRLAAREYAAWALWFAGLRRR